MDDSTAVGGVTISPDFRRLKVDVRELQAMLDDEPGALDAVFVEYARCVARSLLAGQTGADVDRLLEHLRQVERIVWRFEHAARASRRLRLAAAA